jgi:hypothetical protein
MERWKSANAGRSGGAVDAVTACGSGSSEDQATDSLGVVEGDLLCNEPAQGEAEEVELADTLGIDEADGGFGHRFDGGWYLS